MPYCCSCAVEVEKHLAACPLCRGALQEEPPAVLGEYPPAEVEEDFGPGVTWPLIRGAVLGGAGITGMLAVFVTAVADWGQSPGLDWAPYVMAPVLAALLILRVILDEVRRPGRLTGQILAVTGCLLLVLDGIDHRLTWSLGMGLPVVTMVAMSFGAWIVAMEQRRLTWERAVAALFGAVILFCLMLDGWTAYRLRDLLVLSWSIPVALLLAPWVGIVLWAGHRLRHDPGWKRFFHL